MSTNAFEPQGFREVGTVRPDSRGRFPLGRAGITHDLYKQYVSDDGEIRLVPIVEIPARELWAWQNPAVMAKLQRGIEQAARGETTPLDFDAFPAPDDAEG